MTPAEPQLPRWAEGLLLHSPCRAEWPGLVLPLRVAGAGAAPQLRCATRSGSAARYLWREQRRAVSGTLTDPALTAGWALLLLSFPNSGLRTLLEKYRPDGFEVAAVSCNQVRHCHRLSRPPPKSRIPRACVPALVGLWSPPAHAGSTQAVISIELAPPALPHPSRRPQFGGQAPGTDEEEREAAYRKFGTRDFEVYDHILVNGALTVCGRTRAP